MRVVTDSTPLEAPKDPDTCNVFALYKLFASEDQLQTMRENYATPGFGYGSAKKGLFELLWGALEPFREKRAALEQDKDYVEDVLRTGAAKARAEARLTLDRAREAIGLA